MSTEKAWCGDAPTRCDLCDAPITNVLVDGATSTRSPGRGTHGMGLGTGCGQQYEKKCTAKYTSFDGTSAPCEVNHTSHVGSKHKAYSRFGRPIVFSQEGALVKWVKVRG